MTRPRPPGQKFHVHQLQIDWRPPSVTAPGTYSPADVSKTKPAVETTEVVKPVLHLLWDFQTSFPPPTQEAIDAGDIAAGDAEQVRAIHDEHRREMLSVLHDADAVLDARRDGVDPQTGQASSTATGQERLRKMFESESLRLERSYANLLAVYEEVFGTVAAGAFDLAIRAWHAGVEVQVTPGKPNNPPSHSIPASAGTSALPPPQATPCETLPVRKRIIARLPLPKPLPHAVEAGHFGQDEEGEPIHPSAAEVGEITENHAQKVIELLEGLREMQRRGLAERSVIQAEETLRQAIADYADDFGEHAGHQLLAYAVRQIEPDSKRRQRAISRPGVSR